MTQEDKDLLLKDLCARLLYGVKVKAKVPVNRTDYKEFIDKVTSVFYNTDIVLVGNTDVIVGYEPHFEIKPYLFPLSSMTEEQIKEFNSITQKCNTYIGKSILLTDFCNKHHIDWRGFIEKGLAIDATGLNIY